MKSWNFSHGRKANFSLEREIEDEEQRAESRSWKRNKKHTQWGMSSRKNHHFAFPRSLYIYIPREDLFFSYFTILYYFLWKSAKWERERRGIGEWSRWLGFSGSDKKKTRFFCLKKKYCDARNFSSLFFPSSSVFASRCLCSSTMIIMRCCSRAVRAISKKRIAFVVDIILCCIKIYIHNLVKDAEGVNAALLHLESCDFVWVVSASQCSQQTESLCWLFFLLNLLTVLLVSGSSNATSFPRSFTFPSPQFVVDFLAEIFIFISDKKERPKKREKRKTLIHHHQAWSFNQAHIELPKLTAMEREPAKK